MPSYRHHDFGNLYVQFDVKFPKILPKLLPVNDDGAPNEEYDPSAQLRLEEILGKRMEQRPIDDMENAMVEDFELEAVDAGNQRRAHGAGGMDEDDEDGMPHGAERMQCATQ